MLIKPLNPNLFLFLKKLESNNNRNWFLENKGTFKSLEKEVKHFKQIICNEVSCFKTLVSSNYRIAR